MRVLVLGATGYIGQHIMQALEATDWATPIAAARRGVTRTLDATQAADLIHATADVDCVINALSGSSEAITANALALTSALQQHPHLNAIHLSSMAAYGSAQGDVSESHPLLGDLDDYSQAKAKAEQLLQPCASRITIFRPGCVYGHRSPQWSVRMEQLLRAHRLGDLGALGDGCSNLVHVDDVVAAILSALQNAQTRGHAYNLALPQAPSWNEYLIAYALALKATPVSRITARRLKIETKLIAPALKITEIVAHKLGMSTQRLPAMITPSLLRLWQQDIVLSPMKASQALNIAWTPWREAIQRCAEQYPVA